MATVAKLLPMNRAVAPSERGERRTTSTFLVNLAGIPLPDISILFVSRYVRAIVFHVVFFDETGYP